VSLSERTAEIRRIFTNSGLKVLGAVWASSRAMDFALYSSGSGNCVVRCTNAPLQDDLLELKTMLAQGDFTRAAIVYTAEDQPQLTGEIEAYPISRIDELAASLARESTP
jgi:hypothetical protein